MYHLQLGFHLKRNTENNPDKIDKLVDYCNQRLSLGQRDITISDDDCWRVSTPHGSIRMHIFIYLFIY